MLAPEAKSLMIPVEKLEALTRRQSELDSLLCDPKHMAQAGGKDVERIDAIAIMTDTDNTGQSVEAYYGDIAFLSLGDGLPPVAKLTLLVALPSLMLMFAFLYLFTSKHLSTLKAASMACIVGGGAGNVPHLASPSCLTFAPVNACTGARVPRRLAFT